MPSLRDFLVPTFPERHVAAAIDHFEKAATNFGKGDWENSIAKAGKFVEAMLKAIATHCGVPFETGRKFKADAVINALANTPSGSHDDTLRLLIPRACRLIYDIASNRGARHDPDEINPNIMDANVVMPVASWILGETVRYAQKGVVDPTQASELVEGLVEKKYPALEEVDGRIYLHARRKSAVDVALVALAHRYPQRMAESELISIVRANNFSADNSKKAVSRIRKYVDRNENGLLKLLAPGLEKAEQTISQALKGGQRD
jgi:hypothetical protein